MNRILYSSKKKGVALIMTMLVMTMLVVLVGQISYSTKVDSFVAKNSTKNIQNKYALISALNVAVAKIKADGKSEKGRTERYDSFKDAWGNNGESLSLAMGKTKVTYRIIDENSKFHLMNLMREEPLGWEEPKGENDKDKEGEEGEKDDDDKDKESKYLSYKKQFTVLFKSLPAESQAGTDPTALQNSIIAWMEKNSAKSSLPLPFAPNVSHLSLKSLFLASGIKEENLYGSEGAGIADYITFHSDGKTNVNTASKEVLACLSPDLTPEITQQIITYRQLSGEVFKKVDDLKNVPGLDSEQSSIIEKVKPFLTVQSRYFSVEATATTGNLKKDLYALIHRNGEQVYILSFELEDKF